MTAKSSLPGERAVQLDIKILGRDYKVACKEGERAELLDAVAFLDARMHEIKDGGKIAGVDRIAVMAALNLANELLRERKAHAHALAHATPASRAAAVDGAESRRRIVAMQAAIDQTMAGQEKLL
jgi:cell division protein ZapA